MSSEKHVITYPGFAESKDAKQLFTDLEDIYSSQYTFHILPFYEEIPNGDRVVHSIRKHSDALQSYIDGLDGEITMLAKCGGTRPTVAMDDDHIARLSKLCLINPPWRVSNGFLLYQLNRWSATKQEDGSWSIPRDGTRKYIVSKEYVNDVEMSDLMNRFREIARSATKLFVVRAQNDELFPPIRAESINGAYIIDIEGGDHHLMKGTSRQKTIAALGTHAIL